MASIDSKKIIIVLLENNGHYEDDKQAFAISQYLNQWGGTSYHIAYTAQDFRSLRSSPHCRDIKYLWDSGHGLTQKGLALIEESKIKLEGEIK